MKTARLAALAAATLLVVMASPPSDPLHAAPQNADYAAAKAQLDQRLEELRSQYHAFPQPADTPEEIGRLLKHDPTACAAFIRQAVRYEPYLGVLRGPRGTLVAGAGNSADLAVLLRAMIQPAGWSGSNGSPSPKMRFAVAELSEDQAERLVEAASSAAPPRAALAADASQPATLPAPQAEQATQSITRALENRADSLRTLMSHAEADQQQIAAKAPSSDDARQVRRRRAIQAARQHVWLQVQHDGQWQSIDLSPLNLSPPPSGVRHYEQALPESMHQRVTLAIEVETLEKSSLKRQSLAEHRWTAAELNGRAVDVMVVPRELSFDALVGSNGAPPRGLAEQAGTFQHFGIAIGLSGAPPEQGKSFVLRDDGSLITGEAAPASPTGVGAVDPFKRLGRGSPRPAESKPSGTIAGLWLTITFEGANGHEKHVIRRALLDRVGPAARTSDNPSIASDWQDLRRVRLALVQHQQLLIAGGPIGIERVAMDALNALIDGDVLEQALAIRFAQQKDLATAIEQLPLPQLPSDLVAIHDQALTLAQMRCAGTGSCFLVEPSVLIRSETLDLPPGASQVTMQTGIDLASQQLGSVGQADEAVTLHGAWASELERQVLASAPATGEVPVLSSAAGVLRAAGEQGIDLHRIASAQDLNALTGISPDALAVMAQQLKDGAAALIAPARMVQVGQANSYAWWRVDPAGQVLAIGADGRGQAGSEGMTVLTHVSIPMVRRCMKFVKCFNQAIASGGGMNESAAGCLSQSIRDVVKESIDQAIETFIKSPLQDAMNNAITNMRQDVIGEDYEKLYQKAKLAYAKYQQARKAMEDPAGQVPGVQEGRDAADAGSQIGRDFGFRIYLLLDMGSDIAAFSGKL